MILQQSKVLIGVWPKRNKCGNAIDLFVQVLGLFFNEAMRQSKASVAPYPVLIVTAAHVNRNKHNCRTDPFHELVRHIADRKIVLVHKGYDLWSR